jgi:hypothetical protein
VTAIHIPTIGWSPWSALALAAPLLVGGCAGGGYLPPPPPWMAPPAPPPFAMALPPPSPFFGQPSLPDEMPTDAGPIEQRQQAAALPPPGIAHDLTVGGTGYVVGRQAEHLLRRTLKRRPLARADAASEIGTGLATTRAIAGPAVARMGAGGGAAATEEGVVAETSGAVGGEGLAEAGVAAGAGELIVGFAIVAGTVYVIHKLYENYTESQKAGDSRAQ